MLGKRLAIIIFLYQEIPQHRIADALYVSSSTVARMSLNMEIGKYDSILELFTTKKSDLIDLIEFFLTAGGRMPYRAGRGRWKRIFKNTNI